MKSRVLIFVLVTLSGSLEAKPKLYSQLKTDTPYPDAKVVMDEKSCTTVDLALESGPVRTQVGGSCYAYTAIELLNFGQEKKYSAVHLASLNPRKRKPGTGLSEINGFAGGNVTPAVNKGYEVGLCPEDVIPSIDKDNNNTAIYEKIMEAFKDSKEVNLAEECIQDVFVRSNVFEMVEQIRKNFSIGRAQAKKRRVLKLVREYFPSFPIVEFEKIYHSSKYPSDFFYSLISKSCENKLVFLEKKKARTLNIFDYSKTHDTYYFFNDEKRTKMFGELNQALGQKKPVSISFYPYGLILPFSQKQHGTHASTVMGRVWKDNTCQYLVKNSYGEDWRVSWGVKGRSSEEHPGYFVISEQQLKEHVNAITYLE